MVRGLGHFARLAWQLDGLQAVRRTYNLMSSVCMSCCEINIHFRDRSIYPVIRFYFYLEQFVSYDLRLGTHC